MHSCKPVGLICLCIDENVSCNLYIDLHLVLYLSHQTYRLPDAFLRYKKSASTVVAFVCGIQGGGL